MDEQTGGRMDGWMWVDGYTDQAARWMQDGREELPASVQACVCGSSRRAAQQTHDKNCMRTHEMETLFDVLRSYFDL